MISIWEKLNAKKKTGVLDGVPLALPAMTRAGKLQKRAARVGFDWDGTQGIFAKVREELDELQEEVAQERASEIESELGDLLFSCVNLARKLDVDPESALRGANRKFERRMAHMEMLARRRSVRLDDLPIDQLDALWEEAKSSGL